jgi:RNA polymerase sigma-70 factor, ECF subfamily
LFEEDGAMRGKTEHWRSRLGEDLEALLAGCAEGDARAWRRLLEAVRELAMDLALQSYHLSREDAEDLAQLVQIRVSQRLPQLRRPGAFPLWVRRVVHSLALDMFRQRRPMVSLDDPSEVARNADADPDLVHYYDQVLLKADLERALSRLPAHYQEPIRLHVLHGMHQEDIGQLLGRPRSTIATQIERGLQRLRRSMFTMLATGC